ncbi:MAG: RluA family pseudouridine synthase [Candidatus Saccharicenans sp.]
MIEKKFRVSSLEDLRLDLFLKVRLPQLSRSQIQKAIKDGQVAVNAQQVKAGYRLKNGDLVEVRIKESSPEIRLKPEPVDFEILYQDSQILIINKPSGLVVHPGAGIGKGTLVQGLLFRYPEIALVGSPSRPGIVHRLDKETSGVMVVARTQAAYQSLRQQFEDRRIKKFYLALAYGKLKEKKGIIDLPLGRHIHHREKISVKTRKPRVAITHYEVLEEFKETSFLVLRPITGRTHQLRVHLSAIGHPLVGDSRYGGGGKPGLKSPRLFLHAWKLVIRHPLSDEEQEFECPLPAELEEVLQKERGRK